MALQKQNVAIPLAQGVDTKTDDKQLPIGRLAILENGIFQSPLKAQVRPGYDGFGIGVLGSTTNISQGVSLATYRDELLASDSSYIRSYDQGNDAWSTRGKLYTLDITANSILRNNYQQSSQDSAIHSMGLQSSRGRIHKVGLGILSLILIQVFKSYQINLWQPTQLNPSVMQLAIIWLFYTLTLSHSS